MRTLPAFAILLAASLPARATTVTFDLPGSEAPQTKKVTYSCGPRTVTATYVNTRDNQFAVLNIGETTVVTVSVMSGSGARYVGQQYEWWTKGDTAAFSDVRDARGKPITCSVK